MGLLDLAVVVTGKDFNASVIESLSSSLQVVETGGRETDAANR